MCLVIYGGVGAFGGYATTNSRWIPYVMETGSTSHDYHMEAGFTFALYNAAFMLIVTGFWYLSVNKKMTS